MADFSIPSGATLTYQHCADLYEEVVGVAPTATTGDPKYQSIVAAVRDVYFDLQEALQPQGWTLAQVDTWLAGPGLTVHLYCAAALFLRNVIDLDAAWWTVAATYMQKCEDVKKGKVALLDVNGTVLTRDTSSAAADGLQAEETTRNASSGNSHDYAYDAHPFQFTGRTSTLTTAAGARYENTRHGGTSN